MSSKFSGPWCEILYKMANDGLADSQAGSSSEGPYWAGLFLDLNYELDNEDLPTPHAVLIEDKDGSVRADWYNTALGALDAFDEHWRVIHQ